MTGLEPAASGVTGERQIQALLRISNKVASKRTHWAPRGFVGELEKTWIRTRGVEDIGRAIREHFVTTLLNMWSGDEALRGVNGPVRRCGALFCGCFNPEKLNCNCGPLQKPARAKRSMRVGVTRPRGYREWAVLDIQPLNPIFRPTQEAGVTRRGKTVWPAGEKVLAGKHALRAIPFPLAI